MTISILLVDDHTIVREGLRRIIEAESDMRVVGEAATGMQAIELAERLSPRVVVMDIHMSGLDGIEATWQITAAHPRTRVIVLSMYDALPYVRRAVKAGAAGYLLKESAGDELIGAIRRVHGGRQHYSPQMADRLVEVVRANVVESQDLGDPFTLLSQRERLICVLLVQGQSNQRIAQNLHLSAKTVATYRSRILNKLGVSEIVGLVHIAMKYGLTATRPD